ncbi:MAG: ATP-binding protein [Actinomycetota bacterium]
MSTAKILVDGGAGTGKTTFIGSVSDIDPVMTEVPLTGAPTIEVEPGREGWAGQSGRTTTAAFDFGRLTIDGARSLLLFGTPPRGGHLDFLYDDLVAGADGAVVLVDPRRPADSYQAIAAAGERRLPFVVAVNTKGQDRSQLDKALQTAPEVPVTVCDAADRSSAKATLLTLFEIIRETAPGNSLGSARLRTGGAATVGGTHLLQHDRTD